jgi:hypothetical protein
VACWLAVVLEGMPALLLGCAIRCADCMHDAYSQGTRARSRTGVQRFTGCYQRRSVLMALAFVAGYIAGKAAVERWGVMHTAGGGCCDLLDDCSCLMGCLHCSLAVPSGAPSHQVRPEAVLRGSCPHNFAYYCFCLSAGTGVGKGQGGDSMKMADGQVQQCWHPCTQDTGTVGIDRPALDD